MSPSRPPLAALTLAANLAPSADNRAVFVLEELGELTEPGPLAWRLRLRAAPGCPDTARPFLDTVALGCAIENLALALARHRLVLQLGALQAGAPDGDGSVVISARPAAESDACDADPALHAALGERHSNRQLRFRADARLQRVFEQHRQPADLPAARLVSRPEAAGRPWERLIQRAESARFAQMALHQEMMEAVTRDPAARAGIPAGALGLNPIDAALFRLLGHWPVQRALNLLGGAQVAAFRGATLPCLLAPGLYAVAVTGVPPRDALLQGGRLLQRFWLALSAAGLSVQVYAAAAYFATEPPPEIPQDFSRALREAWRPWLGDALPVMLLRAGRGPATPHRARHPGVPEVRTATK